MFNSSFLSCWFQLTKDTEKPFFSHSSLSVDIISLIMRYKSRINCEILREVRSKYTHTPSSIIVIWNLHLTHYSPWAIYKWLVRLIWKVQRHLIENIFCLFERLISLQWYIAPNTGSRNRIQFCFLCFGSFANSLLCSF